MTKLSLGNGIISVGLKIHIVLRTLLDGLNEKSGEYDTIYFCRTVNRTGYLNAGQKAFF